MRIGRRDVFVVFGLILLVAGLFTLYTPLNEGPARWTPRTPLDERIPLIKPMVVPYVSALALGPLTLVIFMVRSVKLAQSALLAAVLLLVTAYLFYFFAQTHVARPVVFGDDVFSEMLRGVYGNDDAYNCFPSLHTGFAVIIGVHWLWFDRRIGRYVAGWCALIIASTLFVHQHYLADMLSGLAVAGAACWAARRVIGTPDTGTEADA